MSRWWRAYDGSIDHPKLLKLSDKMFRAWYTLQCVASANGGTLPPTDDIAVRLRIKKTEVAAWITHLVGARLLDNDNGVFRPHNWDSRQFQSDSSTERVQKHRNKKRNVSTGGACNVSETVEETPPEQNRAESDSEQNTADARALDENGLKQEKALSAMFTALCLNLNRSPPDLRPIVGWLLDGISMNTISNIVTPILKRKADMVSLIYCDAAVREAHSKITPQPSLQIISSKVFVPYGTLAWACWNRESPGGRGWPTRERRDDDGRIQVGWDFETEFPKGYDEATGERIAPADQESAA